MVFDNEHRMHGFVRTGFLSPDGTVEPIFSGHNTVSFDAASVMAEAYGGDTSRVPKYMGFIYGGDGVVLPPVSASTSWSDLADDLVGKCNIQISRFSRRPEVVVGDGSDGSDDADADSNDSNDSNDVVRRGASVVFTAVTRSGDGAKYAFDKSAGRSEDHTSELQSHV